MESKSIVETWLDEKINILIDMLSYLFDNKVVVEKVSSPLVYSRYYRILNAEEDYIYCNILKEELLECDDEMVYEKFWSIIYYIQEKHESKAGRR